MSSSPTTGSEPAHGAAAAVRQHRDAARRRAVDVVLGQVLRRATAG